MYHEANNDSYHVQAELLSRSANIVDFQYLAGHQEQNTERSIPHDNSHQLHGDLVQDQEQMQQNLGLAAHAADDHAERNAERNYSQNVGVVIVSEAPDTLDCVNTGHVGRVKASYNWTVLISVVGLALLYGCLDQVFWKQVSETQKLLKF